MPAVCTIYVLSIQLCYVSNQEWIKLIEPLNLSWKVEKLSGN